MMMLFPLIVIVAGPSLRIERDEIDNGALLSVLI